MKRLAWIAAVSALALAVAGCGGTGLTTPHGLATVTRTVTRGSAGAPTTTTSITISVAPLTSTAPSAATTTTATTASTPPATTLLKVGAAGTAVYALQQRLAELGYRPGPVDGRFGTATASAVLAFQKREGLARDSVVGPAVQKQLIRPAGAGPRPGSRYPRIEVDIARQIAFVMLSTQDTVTLNVSTGNGASYSVPGGGTDVAYTPVGSFTIERKIDGDRHAPLGTLHNPLYFYKGWAIHGAASVPAYPASHGCVRISNSDADWLFKLVPVGTPVVLYDTTGKSPSIANAPANAAPGV